MENEMGPGENAPELEPVEVPEWVPVIEKALAKAEKYWAATDAEWAVFNGLVAELELDLPAVTRKTWASHWDVDRVYHELVGPDPTNPKVRELAVRLQAAGVKAHASARMIGCPPKVIGPMIAAGKKAAAEAEKAAAA